MSTDDKTIRWYNENAESYTAHVRDTSDSVYHAYYEKPAMYALLPDIQGKRVISLGCGSGEDAEYLRTQGAEASVGIDISAGLIEIAKTSYPACSFEVMDMETLHFPDASFDFAYSSLAIHYIEDWTKVFAEVYRILKPQSYFLFSCGHPIRSAMELTENSDTAHVRQLAILKDKVAKTMEIKGDYLQRKMMSNALGAKMPVTTWHKPISEIISEATAAGFLLETFVEPRPLPAMKAISEGDFTRLEKIPEFMILRLVKIGE